MGKRYLSDMAEDVRTKKARVKEEYMGSQLQGTFSGLKSTRGQLAQISRALQSALIPIAKYQRNLGGKRHQQLQAITDGIMKLQTDIEALDKKAGDLQDRLANIVHYAK